jgi:multiple RNA-binding domain-containing protein 1
VHLHGPQSRICVKNVPGYADEAKLRAFFGSKGDVTDVKIVRKKDGSPRHIAFVGFRTVEAGPDAVKYFNRAFFDATRLVVEAATPVGQQPPARQGTGPSSSKDSVRGAVTGATPSAVASSVGKGLSREKLAKSKAADGSLGGSLEMAKGEGKGKGKGKGKDMGKGEGKGTGKADDLSSNPKFKAFLEVMQPRHATALWKNDDFVEPGAGGAPAHARGPSGRAGTAAAAERKRLLQDSSDSSDSDSSDGGSSDDSSSSSDSGTGVRAGHRRTGKDYQVSYLGCSRATVHSCFHSLECVP